MTAEIFGAIIVALITGGISLLGSVLTSNNSSALTTYKIEELQKDFGDLKIKVEKHNNLVERMALVEASTKSAHHRIDEIKGQH